MEQLFQDSPSYFSANPDKIACSFTESVQSYMKAASRESWILENNHRKPQHEIVLRFFKECGKQQISSDWGRLHANLKRAKITYAAVLELTKRNGKFNNRIHIHFLIDSPLEPEELMKLMKVSCLNSRIGIWKRDFDLCFANKGIKRFTKKKIDYFTKNGHEDKVRMFKKGLQIQKFRYSSDWFIDKDGNHTTRGKILERIIREYKIAKGVIHEDVPANDSPSGETNETKPPPFA